ncbi:hypothetical protein V9T40_000817 [Parthenolecanium corni]|uniref:Peptidase M13 C-terminal domain-containing protein n=1 Tax=Parthenolecanium corni TaxID=536013 RepID=A0AAN9TE30_9HEMI
MNLLPPFHLETEPRKDFGTILGKIHRFSFEGSKFFHNVAVRPIPLKNTLNVLTIGSIMENPTIVEHQNGEIPTNAIPGENKFEAPRREYLTSVINHLYNYSEFKLTDDMKSTIARRVNDVLNLERRLLDMIPQQLQDDNEVERNPLYGGSPYVKAQLDELLKGGEIQVNFYDYILALFSDADSMFPDLRLTKEMLEETKWPIIFIPDYHEFKALYEALRETGSFVFVVPITSLEFPLYDLGLEVLNYGTTGFIIAHEMGHAMDVAGSGYDANGNQKHCLTENSRKTFYEIIQRFIDTYNKYEVYFADREPIQVNGQISVNENMADWQGFNMALMAYKMYEKEYGIKPKLIKFENLSPEKLFTLAFASEHCIKPRIGHVVRQTTTLPHPPENIRVNGILRNSRQFSEAWGCADGSMMNPPDKCEIWF